MKTSYQPNTFFLWTFLVTWISWFLSAYFSFREETGSLYVLLMLPGLVAPFVIALVMMVRSGDPSLLEGFRNKLFNLRLIRLSSLPLLLLIMPVAVLLSIWISTWMGQSADQFRFSEGFSFSAGFMPVLLVLFLAAAFEELGWRSYALDSLRAGRSYFSATLVFGFLWAFWHFPLFFIKGYYHYEIFHQNSWFAVNFMVSTIPLAFIISWVCQKNGGSIAAAVLFHFLINLCQEALQMTQVTKCIETFVLILIAAGIVIWEREMFFDAPAHSNFTFQEERA